MTEIQITNLADATIRIQTAEKNIRDNWVDMANTLIQVRDDKLWEEGGYTGFEQYVNEELGYGKQWVYKLMKTPEVAEIIPVTNPTVAAELVALPEERWEEAWDNAKQIAATNEPSGRHVRRAVKAIKDGRSVEEEIERVSLLKHPEMEVVTPIIINLEVAQSKFEAILDSMREIYHEINALAQEKDGVWIDMSFIKTDFKNIGNALRFAKPHADCIFCAGDGCEKCLDSGMLNKERFDAYTQSMEQR